MKMPKELKQKWIEALRSGEYKQFQQGLKGDVFADDGALDGVGHCCLGVLCEIGGLEFTPVGTSGELQLTLSGKTGKPAVDDYEALGVILDRPSGGNFRDDAETELIAANDNGVPFDKIADMIEEKVEAI